MTCTDQLVTTPLTSGSSTPDDPAPRSPAGDRPDALHHPVRISRIGSDRLEVLIRPVDGCRELLALVDRLERLIGAGYDAIDVVFEPTRSSWSSRREEGLAEPTGSPRLSRGRG